MSQDRSMIRLNGPATVTPKGTRMRACLVVSIIALLSAPSALAIPEIRGGSRITRVTVHADRAEVTREADVRVPAGESQVEFTLLPRGIDRDSLRVSGHGVAASIGAVELRDVAQQVERPAEFAAAIAEVERIEREIAKIDGENATDSELRKYFDSLRDAASKGQSEANAALKPDAAALQQMLEFLRNGYTGLAHRHLQRTATRAPLAEQLALAQARLEASTPAASIHSRSAIVDIDASTAGSLTLELSYVVSGARWRPTYRAALDAEGKDVELLSEAVVSQLTGEDWLDVKLTLSTAAPAKGLDSPYLASWLLEPNATATDQMFDKRQSFMVPKNWLSERAGVRIEGMSAADSVNGGLRDFDAASARPPAQLAQGTHQAVFIVPGRSDVASDQAEHRVTLRTDTLPVKLAYRVVPSVKAEAFALAIGKAPEDRPLLAGPVRVVAGGSFLGSFVLPETGPGAEVRVPFGADNRVKVTRVTLPQARSNEGAGGKDRQVVQAFRTTVENLRDVPVTVALEERIPVAQDERVSVKLGEKTTDGSGEIADRPGVLNWKLELAPKEKRDVTLEYTVRHPKDMVLPGL